MENVDVFCGKEFCLLVGLIDEERSLVSKVTNLFFRKLNHGSLLKSLVLAATLLFGLAMVLLI